MAKRKGLEGAEEHAETLSVLETLSASANPNTIDPVMSMVWTAPALYFQNLWLTCLLKLQLVRMRTEMQKDRMKSERMNAEMTMRLDEGRKERERMNAEMTMRLDEERKEREQRLDEEQKEREKRLDEERKEREKMDEKLDRLLTGANSVSECGEVVQVTDLLML
jgi:catalase (peroxidase I)